MRTYVRFYNRLAGRQVTYSLRRAGTDDVEFLWELLSYASHSGVDPGALRDAPELARYVEGWGRPTDLGVVAVDAATGEGVGAAWLRLLAGDAKGYGYVDDTTPELVVAVLPAHRGGGIGARLLTALLDAARGTFDAVSLSVRADNPARRLYERLGFRTVGESDVGATSVTMRIGLTP
jgi:ribosomal protein S18 acetylase RimI-like enzyme